MKNTIIEAGHFYLDHGFSGISLTGWNMGKTEMEKGDNNCSMLFIDDVHSVGDMSEIERNSPVIPITISTENLQYATSDKAIWILNHYTNGNIKISPNILILESELDEYVAKALGVLKGLPKKSRAKEKQDGAVYCSGIKLIGCDEKNNQPTCVMYDTALTVVKSGIALQAINILPENYQDQQKSLQRIVSKVLPGYGLNTLYY